MTTLSTPAVLLEAACEYARTVDVDVDLSAVEWEVSHRATRRAGACKYDRRTETVTISLTWDAHREHGWGSTRKTIRHELVHAWEFQHFGESGHGPRFRRKAAELRAPRHCEPFSDPRYVLRCECGWETDRHRASRPVKRPDAYRCKDCGGRYEVEHVDSGRTWTGERGFERARTALGDEW